MKKTLLPALLLITLFSHSQIQFTLVDPVTQTLTLFNYGSSDVDISNYRLCSLFEYTFGGVAADANVNVLTGDFVLSQNEGVTFTWSASTGFALSGSDMGLYLPSGGFNNPANMVCFMEYGSAGNGREPEAVLAGLWEAGTFVSGNPSYAYIGNGTQSGVEFWQSTVPPDTDLVINEVDSDTPGTDMLEFIELYGAPNEALDGMVLVLFNGTTDQAYNAIDLDGFACDASGFFLLGNAGVPGVSITFNNNSLQNGPDAAAIYWGNAADWPDGTPVSAANLIDAVVYDTGQADDTGLLILLSGGGQVNEAGSGNSVGHSLSRVPDGGSQANTSTYVAQLPTPGATNILPACDGGFVLTEGGDSELIVCTDGNADVVVFAHMTTEPGATYEYVITDQSDNIILYPAGDNQDFNSYSVGIYKVYGISYYGSIDAATAESGDPIAGILADGACLDVSQSFINVVVQECVEVPECSDLFISEYIEGLNSNKAIEIFNPTNLPVDLTPYALKNFANGSTAASNIFGLSGILNPGDVYVVVHPNAAQVYQDLADATATVAFFNGNDAVVLLNNGNAIDAIGVVGEDPGIAGWVVGTGTTTDHVLVRKGNVNAPTTDWFVSAATQWDVYDPGNTDFLGSHVFVPCGTTIPQVSFSTTATGVAEEAGNVIITVNVFNPIATVQVTVDVADGTALSTEDYDNSQFPLVLTFPQGDINPQTIMIPITDDLIEEPLEYFSLAMTADLSEVNLIEDFMTVVIEENDIYYPLYSIAEVSTQNTNGVCDSLEVDCELRGIVHGINFNSAGINFTMIDATGGINVFRAEENLGYTVVEGDSVHVRGEIYQFMGLISFLPVSIDLIDGGHPLETPTVVTALGEENESHMVRIECVELADSSQWDNSGSAFNVVVTDGVNSFTLHIDGDSNIFGTDPPDGHFSVTGIGGQFDTTEPFTSSYQMWPRYLDDFSDQVIADFTSDPATEIIYGDAGATITFVNTSTGASDVVWDYGDGTTSEETEEDHLYSFDFLDTHSEFTVTLTITSTGGCSDSYSFTFTSTFVGVDEKGGLSWSVYPNPATDQITVRSTVPMTEFVISDGVGHEIMRRDPGSSLFFHQDVSSLAAGIYVVSIVTDQGMRSQMVLKH